MRTGDIQSPFDKETKYRIVKSDTPVKVDGYKIGEPKYLECDTCGARMLLTPKPTPGVDDTNHQLVIGDHCLRWAAHSEYWKETHPDAVEKIPGSLPENEFSRRKPDAANGRED